MVYFHAQILFVWLFCLKIIASKVRKGKYHTLKAFEADVQLLFDNAREYNLEGSEVYQVRQFWEGRGGEGFGHTLCCFSSCSYFLENSIRFFILNSI